MIPAIREGDTSMRACIVVLAAVTSMGCSRSSDSPLPNPANVKTMHAQWIVPPKNSEAPFDIHDNFAQILDALKPYRVDPQPSTWVVLGGLTIETTNGTTTVLLFDPGKGEEGEMAFKIGETYYLGGSRRRLNQAMAAVSPK